MSHLTHVIDTIVIRTRLWFAEERDHADISGKERGSITIEQALWAVAMIVIVGIVVTAITNFVTMKAGEIR